MTPELSQRLGRACALANPPLAQRMKVIEASADRSVREVDDLPGDVRALVLAWEQTSHANKGASDPHDPNPVEAEHVYNQLLQNYPPKAIKWVKKARWIGPIEVPTDRVDDDDADSWAASHQPERVAHFTDKLKKGKPVHPGVSVQEPGASKIKVADGHHRYLAAVRAGEPFLTYVGFVDADGGPWDEMHTSQFHAGDDPQNKSVVPGLFKVGPKGYIHGWIFVGAPGVGDRVSHPSHGSGTVTGHDGKHVTVAFDKGTKKTFEARKGDGAGKLVKRTEHDSHRADELARGSVKPKDLTDEELKGADKEFTRRAAALGKPDQVSRTHKAVRDELARRAKTGSPQPKPQEHPADRVLADHKAVESMTDAELASVKTELFKRSNHAASKGDWDESGRMDAAHTAANRESGAREEAQWRAHDLAHYPNVHSAVEDESLALVRRDTERRAKEQGIHPDLIEGHRAARVEQARRANPDPSAWTVDHMHIFGGTPEQHVTLANMAGKVTADVPPEKMATLKHVEITKLAENVNGDYTFQSKEMRVDPKLFSSAADEVARGGERTGWYSKSGHTTGLARTFDHELGHHLDGLLGDEERIDMFGHLSDLMGSTPLHRVQRPISAHFSHIASAHDFVANNKSDIINSVGTYAATNSYELVAELWTEYHGKKLNGISPSSQFKTSQVIGRTLAGHETPFNPKEDL